MKISSARLYSSIIVLSFILFARADNFFFRQQSTMLASCRCTYPYWDEAASDDVEFTFFAIPFITTSQPSRITGKATIYSYDRSLSDAVPLVGRDRTLDLIDNGQCGASLETITQCRPISGATAEWTDNEASVTFDGESVSLSPYSGVYFIVAAPESRPAVAKLPSRPKGCTGTGDHCVSYYFVQEWKVISGTGIAIIVGVCVVVLALVIWTIVHFCCRRNKHMKKMTQSMSTHLERGLGRHEEFMRAQPPPEPQPHYPTAMIVPDLDLDQGQGPGPTVYAQPYALPPAPVYHGGGYHTGVESAPNAYY